MTLDQIDQLLDNAHFASDLFGDGNWSDEYKRMSIAVHPDKFTDPVEKARAEDIFKRLGVWSRLAETPELLESGTKTYTLGKELGRGDLSTVRIAFDAAKTPLVAKISTNAGVAKLLLKERETLDTTRKNVQNPAYQRYFPTPIDSFLLPDKRRANIFDFHEGLYSAETIKNAFSGGLDPKHIIWMFKRAMTAVGLAHRSGFVHGAPIPPHLMYHIEGHGLRIIDWTLASQIGKPIIAAPAAFKEWYPSECQKKRGVTPATDIFLVAKTMVWLLGGDPLRDSFPEDVPLLLQTYLRGCLLQSPTMRPNDAWRCIEEMSDVGYRLYGKPKFHALKL